MKIIMLKGLPASGKTSWAKRITDKHFDYRRVNKDDLRAMFGTPFSTKNEAFVVQMRDEIIKRTLKERMSIIVDDTNYAPKHKIRLLELAEEFNAEFEVEEFFTPVEECIRRDYLRANSVGAQVIWDMYNKYVRTTDCTAPYDPRLPTCVIVDIDGTIALKGDRGPFDWDNVDKDTVNKTVREVVKKLSNKTTVIFLSGRDDICEEKTRQWLEYNVMTHNKEYYLYMREHLDCRKDYVVKEEIYRKNIEGKYNVLVILDDRPQVIRMWKGLGLPVFNVCGFNREF